MWNFSKFKKNSIEWTASEKNFEKKLSESYIKLIDWLALQAEQRLKETGKITVVVQDRGSPILVN